MLLLLLCVRINIKHLRCLWIRGFLLPPLFLLCSAISFSSGKCCFPDVPLVLHSDHDFVFTFAKLHDAQRSSLFLVCRGQRWNTCQLLSTMWNWYLIPKSSGKEARKHPGQRLPTYLAWPPLVNGMPRVLAHVHTGQCPGSFWNMF